MYINSHSIIYRKMRTNKLYTKLFNAEQNRCINCANSKGTRCQKTINPIATMTSTNQTMRAKRNTGLWLVSKRIILHSYSMTTHRQISSLIPRLSSHIDLRNNSYNLYYSPPHSHHIRPMSSIRFLIIYFRFMRTHHFTRSRLFRIVFFFPIAENVGQGWGNNK